MGDILKLIPGAELPREVFWGLLVIAAFWMALPRIQELLPWRRYYLKEKMRLELTKLHYEIESIKKQNGLDALEAPYKSFGPPDDQEIGQISENANSSVVSDDLPCQEDTAQPTDRVDQESGKEFEPSAPVGFAARAFLGALGGATVAVLASIQTSFGQSGEAWHGIKLLQASIILSVCGALAATVSRKSSYKTAFLTGLVAILIAVQIIATIGNRSVQERLTGIPLARHYQLVAEEGPAVLIPQDTGAIILSLALPESIIDGKLLTVVVYDDEDRVIATLPEASRDSRGLLQLVLPTRELESGQYEIRLFDGDPDSGDLVARYSYRIELEGSQE